MTNPFAFDTKATIKKIYKRSIIQIIICKYAVYVDYHFTNITMILKLIFFSLDGLFLPIILKAHDGICASYYQMISLMRTCRA